MMRWLNLAPKLVLVAIALGASGSALAADPPPVTILRGSSAPPEPAAPTTVVQRETVVYQPVYVPPPVSYFYPLPIFVQRFPRHAVPRTAIVTTNLPNGWPLFRAGRR